LPGPSKISVSKIEFENRLMIVNGQAFAYHGQMESAHTRILFLSFRSHEIWIKVIIEIPPLLRIYAALIKVLR